MATGTVKWFNADKGYGFIDAAAVRRRESSDTALIPFSGSPGEQQEPTMRQTEVLQLISDGVGCVNS